MSIQELSTDFKDDVLDAVANENRKYQMTYNTDGTVSFTDVTKYSQNGSLFGAKEVNEERARINQLNKNLSAVKDHIVESGKKKVGSRYYYYEKYASGKLAQWGVGSYSYTDGYGTIEYPVAFAGAVEDYCLFVQPRYIATKVIEVMVASKVTTAKGNVYARHLDYSKPDTHPFDWYAIGSWK